VKVTFIGSSMGLTFFCCAVAKGQQRRMGFSRGRVHLPIHARHHRPAFDGSRSGQNTAQYGLDRCTQSKDSCRSVGIVGRRLMPRESLSIQEYLP
jgi:hypothetical protein